MNIIKKILRSINFAIGGLAHTYRVDHSFRLEITIGLPIFLVILFVLSPVTVEQFIFIVFAYVFILFAEIINTALEIAWKKLHPGRDELVGMSKDIASSAVLLSFIFAGIVVVVLFWDKFIT